MRLRYAADQRPPVSTARSMSGRSFEKRKANYLNRIPLHYQVSVYLNGY